MSTDHRPVLLQPVLDGLALKPGQTVLDGTVGLGGHAAALLERVRPGGRLIGLDVDERMLTIARERLGQPADAELIHASYADAPAALAERGIDGVDAALLDLGMNSAQVDDAARGFSFHRDGPLDMRFDQTARTSAVDIVNGWSEEALADLFYEFGQEGMSRRIARRICQVRHGGRITSTWTLARAVESVYEATGAAGKTHPATRVFQALRIAVNAELENLQRFLEALPALLKIGGRAAFISFHSLEDGMVKDAIRDGRKAGTLEELTKRPLLAEGPERYENPRSRSAKLRLARRIA